MGLVAPEVFAGTPPTGLDLIGDQQDPAGIEFLLERTEEAIGWRSEPADPLNRFGDQAGNISRRHHVEHLGEVIDAGVGECGVVELAERASQPIAALDEMDIQP